MTNELENVTNATVIGLSVVPALPPPPPTPPIIPPSYENSTDEEGDPIIIETIPVAPPPPLVVEETESTEEVSIEFVIPAEMRVTMEPHAQVGTSYHSNAVSAYLSQHIIDWAPCTCGGNNL